MGQTLSQLLSLTKEEKQILTNITNPKNSPEWIAKILINIGQLKPKNIGLLEPSGCELLIRLSQNQSEKGAKIEKACRLPAMDAYWKEQLIVFVKNREIPEIKIAADTSAFELLVGCYFYNKANALKVVRNEAAGVKFKILTKEELKVIKKACDYRSFHAFDQFIRHYYFSLLKQSEIDMDIDELLKKANRLAGKYWAPGLFSLRLLYQSVGVFFDKSKEHEKADEFFQKALTAIYLAKRVVNYPPSQLVEENAYIGGKMLKKEKVLSQGWDFFANKNIIDKFNLTPEQKKGAKLSANGIVEQLLKISSSLAPADKKESSSMRGKLSCGV